MWQMLLTILQSTKEELCFSYLHQLHANKWMVWGHVSPVQQQYSKSYSEYSTPYNFGKLWTIQEHLWKYWTLFKVEHPNLEQFSVSFRSRAFYPFLILWVIVCIITLILYWDESALFFVSSTKRLSLTVDPSLVTLFFYFCIFEGSECEKHFPINRFTANVILYPKLGLHVFQTYKMLWTSDDSVLFTEVVEGKDGHGDHYIRKG